MNTAFARFLVQRGEITGEAADRFITWVSRSARVPIGMIAVGHGLISGAQIDDILDRQSESGMRFGEAAVDMGLLTDDQVETLLDIQAFRQCAEQAEVSALLGLLPFQEVARALGDFLQKESLRKPGPAMTPQGQ